MEIGKKLGPYEILSPLGVGGMGEVYLARDTKLDRQVAIKVLPAAMTRDQDSDRFGPTTSWYKTHEGLAKHDSFQRQRDPLRCLDHAGECGRSTQEMADGRLCCAHLWMKPC